MAISKIGSRGIVDCSVAAADFAPGTITAAKLAGSIANDKLANSTITIGGEAISLGASDNALNLTDWQSKITADGSTVTTMVSGRGYFVDTSSAAGILKLPASAAIGDYIQFKDYAGTFATNNLTIQRNGHKIQGDTADSKITSNRAAGTLVYVDATKGWLFWEQSNVAGLVPLYLTATGGTITTSSFDKIHTFTGDGNFVVSQLANGVGTGSTNNVQYLVVAGGGGGGFDNSGGGGAGGFRHDFPGCGLTIPAAATYPITVGAGGAGRSGSRCGTGSNGSNSVFSTITSAGGGGGGSDANGSYGAGANGGSGGGGAKGGNTKTGGTGNTPPVSPSQGNNGGAGAPYPPSSGAGGGGGGGAGAVGQAGPDSSPSGGGNGGNGTANSITGSSVTYAGGGGGGSPGPGGSGGSGGGGTGGNSPAPNNKSAGTANTGGGGGGATGSSDTGMAGGSGIVVLRYRFTESV
jgi:hypothetical protein